MFDAGIVTFVPRGDWVNNVTYYPLNIVNYDGLSWIARRENVGQTPADGQYWQPNGTAVPIATTSVAGKVMPDGTSITVDQQGHISAVFSADLDDLDNVSITSPSNNQVLKYNATSQKWENGTDTGGLIPHLIIISETGSTVTVTKGAWSTTATETSTGHFECDVPEFGTYTIDAVLAGDDAQVSLVVDAVKIYTVDDSHFHADITVTYPTGATVSCSKSGETTMYATGSPYTFTVHSSGTWTITGVLNGVTITENVTISTSGQTESVYFQNTIEVDLYSAASDTVSFTDETGSKTATTDSTGKSEGVSITYSRFKNNAIQFTSSVAKNPSDLTADYTKLIYLDANTTEVKVMPEDSLYWYGYESSDLEDLSTANGWSGTSYTLVSPTHNTNYIALSSSNAQICGVGTKTIKNANSVKAIYKGETKPGSIYGELAANSSKTLSGYSETNLTSGNITYASKDLSALSNVFYWADAYGASMSNKIYALWHKNSSNYNFFSAANDIVTYKDSNNNDVVFAITDEDGYAKVDYSAIPSGTYTLYSSVAKDPDNLSNAYSKSVTISNATTSIYLMPNNNVLYWYGYTSSNWEDMITSNGWTYGANLVAPTHNTNDIYYSINGTGLVGSGTKNTIALTSASKVKTVYKVTNTSISVQATKAKEPTGGANVMVSSDFSSTSLALGELDVSSASQDGYVEIYANSSRTAHLYAIWYE